LQAGEFIVADSSGGIFHRATATFLFDPYSAANTNQVRVRLEANALFEIVEPKKFIVSGASLVT
jgi:hypothetical protein